MLFSLRPELGPSLGRSSQLKWWLRVPRPVRMPRLEAARRSAMRGSAHSALAALLALTMAACSQESASTQTSAAQVEKSVDYCALASDEELAKLYKKPLISTASDNGCMWSEKPGGMAYLDINVHDYQRDLRKYFDAQLPSYVKLVEITDLGDGGLMTVSEGSLGVVVVRKGDRVLQSAATFLDIKPGSEKQKILWQIYGRALAQ